MTDTYKKDIDDFYELISPWEKAYAHAGFSYIAVRCDEAFNILQGRLFLDTVPSTISRTPFQTKSVRAGYFSLSEVGLSYRELISQLMAGGVHTPHGSLVSPKEENGQISTYLVPFHQEGMSGGNRLTVLTLTGARRHSFIRQPELD